MFSEGHLLLILISVVLIAAGTAFVHYPLPHMWIGKTLNLSRELYNKEKLHKNNP